MIFSATGCGHGKPKPDENTPSAAADENEMGSSDQGKAFGLQTLHFAYDSFLLDTEAKSLLAQNGEILKSHGGLRVQIEGHCDQRGGIQYNIALGEKWANSVRTYLVDLGVPSDHLTTLSYGKERPLDSSENERAYSKNRRANFAVTAIYLPFYRAKT